MNLAAYGPMPLHGLIDQFAWIEQVLRPVMLARPAASLRQFHAEKVAHFLVAAVADSSYKLSIPVMHSNICPCRDRAFHLKAYARKRNIFQIGNPPPRPSALILPDQFHQLRTQQPVLFAPVLALLHTCIIGSNGATVRIRLSFGRWSPPP